MIVTLALLSVGESFCSRASGVILKRWKRVDISPDTMNHDAFKESNDG